MNDPSMSELLGPAIDAAAHVDDEKDAKAAKASDDAVKKTEAEAKAKSLKEANDKLTISGPVAIRPTADCKGVTICKAGAAAPVLEFIPFADTVVVPDAKSVVKPPTEASPVVVPISPKPKGFEGASPQAVVHAAPAVDPSQHVASSSVPVADPHPPTHADKQPVKPSGFAQSSHQTHGTHNPKSENYWDKPKS